MIMWKSIEGYEGLYKVSRDGHVLSIKSARYLAEVPDKNGNLKVGLSKNSHRDVRFIHRFVAMLFIPNPEKKQFVIHLNGDNSDNRVKNLAWANRKEVLDNFKKNNR